MPNPFSPSFFLGIEASTPEIGAGSCLPCWRPVSSSSDLAWERPLLYTLVKIILFYFFPQLLTSAMVSGRVWETSGLVNEWINQEGQIWTCAWLLSGQQSCCHYYGVFPMVSCLHRVPSSDSQLPVRLKDNPGDFLDCLGLAQPKDDSWLTERYFCGKSELIINIWGICVIMGVPLHHKALNQRNDSTSDTLS